MRRCPALPRGEAAPMKQARPESERIAFLLRRDGYAATRKWVERTVGLYREALAQRGHFASDPAYRPLFEKAVQEFEEWLVSDRERHAEPPPTSS
jgi:hypothetical protein